MVPMGEPTLDRPKPGRRLTTALKARLRRHAHRARRRRRLPPMSVMPTLITLGNLICGFAAIHFAARPIEITGLWGWSSLTTAGALIFLGMFLDSIDGTVARLTRSTSDLGAQLDSLGDLVSFGVAPAFMMLRLVSHYLGPEGEQVILGPEADLAAAKVFWGVAAVYVCAAALRLARFNVETPSESKEDHLLFRGLPSPGAAGAVVSLVVLHQHRLHVSGLPIDEWSLSAARLTALGIPLVTLLCALAMVSSIPYVHFVNRYLGGRRSFGYVAKIAIPIFFAIWWFQETLAICFVTYALTGPLRWLWKKRSGRHAGEVA